MNSGSIKIWFKLFSNGKFSFKKLSKWATSATCPIKSIFAITVRMNDPKRFFIRLFIVLFEPKDGPKLIRFTANFIKT